MLEANLTRGLSDDTGVGSDKCALRDSTMLRALFRLSNLDGAGVVKSGLVVGERAVGVRLELDEGES